MAKRPLKVFRTAIGFEDAYVAASSRKAALEAWGTVKDLFARGVAEKVTDPKLTAKPLERPGEVIRLPRASIAEHLAAAKVPEPVARKTRKSASGEPAEPKKRAPKPGRAKVDAAREALDQHEERAAAALAAIDEEIAKLRERKVEIRERDAKVAEELRSILAREEDRHRAALDQWEG